MAYSIEFRKLVMDYRKEHSLRGTSRHFNVAVSTIQDWEKLLCENGNLCPVKPNRQPKKLPPDELKKYIQEHPDAYQSEIAEVFGCAQSAVNKALKRLHITRKKKRHIMKNKIMTK